MTSQNVNMMNYISENVAVAGQSGVIERRNFYQVFISLSLLFIPVLALYFFSGMNAQQEYKMQVLRSEVISIAKEMQLYSWMLPSLKHRQEFKILRKHNLVCKLLQVLFMDVWRQKAESRK